MTTSYGSVALIEVVWTLCAVPGFLIWAKNLHSARCDLRAVQRLGVIDGRMVWAKFAVLKNTAFMLIEASFIAIGITAMVQKPINLLHPSVTPTGYVLTGCLLGTSILMTVVGLRWRKVSWYLLEAARVRKQQGGGAVE